VIELGRGERSSGERKKCSNSQKDGVIYKKNDVKKGMRVPRACGCGLCPANVLFLISSFVFELLRAFVFCVGGRLEGISPSCCWFHLSFFLSHTDLNLSKNHLSAFYLL